MESTQVFDAFIFYSWYFIRSFKAKVDLKNNFKVTVLLNTDVEINVMTKNLIEDVNLAMRQGPNLKLVSHIGHSHFFLGFCKNIKIAIKRLKIRHAIFMVEARDHNLVVSQSFLNFVKFS